MTKYFLCLAAAIVLSGGLAYASPWKPSKGHKQIEIWSGTPPDARPVQDPEESRPGGTLVGGKPWTSVGPVSKPTITVYSPKGKNTGAAVVVFPGGGYEALAIDLSGTEICDWLTSNGITCILLKYRVPGRKRRPQTGPYPEVSPIALEDAQRAMGLARFHASEWHIHRHKIGVIGSSAGGHLAVAISTNFKKRLYPAVDAADKESCRPDFAIALYPGFLSFEPQVMKLNPHIHVTADVPPTFLLQAEDDPVNRVENSLVYYIALRKAGVPVEMHLYAHGGHAFGLRSIEAPIAKWPQLVKTWLATIGMIPK